MTAYQCMVMRHVLVEVGMLAQKTTGHFLYLITSEETVNKKITCVSDHSNNLL